MSAVPATGDCMERHGAAIVHQNDLMTGKVCMTTCWRFPAASFASTWRGSARCFRTIVDTDAAPTSDDRMDVPQGEYSFSRSTVGIN